MYMATRTSTPCPSNDVQPEDRAPTSRTSTPCPSNDVQPKVQAPASRKRPAPPAPSPKVRAPAKPKQSAGPIKELKELEAFVLMYTSRPLAARKIGCRKVPPTIYRACANRNGTALKAMLNDGLLMPTVSKGCVYVPGSTDTAEMLKSVNHAAESVSNILEVHSKLNQSCPKLTWDAVVGTNYLTRSVTKQKRSTHGRVEDIVVEDSTPICSRQRIGLVPTTTAPGMPQGLGSIGKLMTITSSHSLQRTAGSYFTMGTQQQSFTMT